MGVIVEKNEKFNPYGVLLFKLYMGWFINGVEVKERLRLPLMILDVSCCSIYSYNLNFHCDNNVVEER